MQCNSLLALGLLVALNVVEKVVALDTVCVAVEAALGSRRRRGLRHGAGRAAQLGAVHAGPPSKEAT